MARFNEEIFNTEALSEKELSMVGVYLQSLLPSEQYNSIKATWHKEYGSKPSTYPFWRYCLDNIEVSYKKTKEKADDKTDSK